MNADSNRTNSQSFSSDADQRPTNVRWMVFVLGCGTSWFLYLHRYTFALIKPKIKDEWQLDNTELGLLDSAFQVCYSVFQVPSGLLVDATGAHLFLGGIIILWSIGLALHAWAPDLNSMRLARAFLGTGQAGAFAAISRVTRNWFPFTSRTFVQGLIGVFSGRIGAVCGFLLFATVLIGILKIDWRTSVYILAAAGIVHGIIFLALFRNSPRQHPWANKAEADLIEGIQPNDGAESSTTAKDAQTTRKKRMSVREMFSRMSAGSIVNLLFLTLASSLSTIADNIYSSWIPQFLKDVHHIDDFKTLGIYSMIPLLGGASGGALAGYLNDRIIRRTGNRRWTRSLIGLTGKGTAGVLLTIALLTSYDNPYRFCVFLFFVKFFADMGLATRWGTITDISGKATATVFALNNALASLIGLIAPPMYGWVSEHDNGWYSVFIIAACVYVACALSWLLIDCTKPLFGDDETHTHIS
jgi:ACS family glucarate transporter-like MFS transporter